MFSVNDAIQLEYFPLFDAESNLEKWQLHKRPYGVVHLNVPLTTHQQNIYVELNLIYI